jgi:uncharacterized membrane protein YhaH (DUF805 family)
MLPVPFTFQGRLERLPYFKGCLGLVGACFVPAFLAFRMAPKLRDHDTSAVVALAIMLALIGITLGWISLAMQVRRFRDMGWPALYVIPASWALQAADPFVAMNFPAMALGRQHNHTAAGLVLILFMMGALFFWPSREDDEHPSLTRTSLGSNARDFAAASALLCAGNPACERVSAHQRSAAENVIRPALGGKPSRLPSRHRDPGTLTVSRAGLAS